MKTLAPNFELDPSKWVRDHGDYLYRFAVRRVRDSEAAKDLVQETLLSAIRARDSFRGGSSERTWLTGILKRRTIDWLRTQTRDNAHRRQTADRWIDSRFTRSGRWKAKPSDWSLDNPARELSRGDFQKALAGCLDKLPSKLRTAFVLRHVHEQSTEIVCRELGAAANNLWVMLHRARLRLWSCMTENWFGERDEPDSQERFT